ncbi:MAG: methyltransferase domain-containing protein [Solirubrobacterales bacterium]
MESGQQTGEGPGGQDEEIRAGMRAMWGLVASGWEENADFVDRSGADMTAAMLAAANLKSGERVLELACGPGGVGMAAAEQVGPDGEVVLSDVAPEMTAIAASRANENGLTNVTTQELDLEQIDQPDGSYDAALCREGLMLAVDPARAAAEIRRVLKPGGRAVVTVWGPRERNPWLGAMLDAVGAQLGGTVPPPGVPGPFSLDGREKLHAALTGGGFEDVDVEEVEVPWLGSSFDQWWQVTAALAGPLAKLLEAQPAEAIEAIRAHAREALGEYETASGLEIPGVTLVGTAALSP